MSFVDKFTHPNFEPNKVYHLPLEERPTKKDMPYLLEHVYDLTSKRYVSNNKMCCYYSPKSKHKYCKHNRDCLFKRSTIWESYTEFQQDIRNPELHELLDTIWTVKKCISDLHKISNDYLNGDIVYHPSLESYYTIQSVYTDDGYVKTIVSVSDNFREGIRKMITTYEMQLRELKRELYRKRRLLK